MSSVFVDVMAVEEATPVSGAVAPGAACSVAFASDCKGRLDLAVTKLSIGGRSIVVGEVEAASETTAGVTPAERSTSLISRPREGVTDDVVGMMEEGSLCEECASGSL